MNKLTGIIIGGLVALSTGSAWSQTSNTTAASDVYVRPAVVVAFPGHFDTAVGASLAVGATIARAHSVEVEVTRFKSKDRGMEVEFTPLLANYDYHFTTRSPWTFSVGGSVGVVFEKLNYWWFRRETQSAFAGGGRVGVAYNVTKNVAITGDLSSVYIGGTDFVTSGNIGLLRIGAVFRF